MRSGARLGKHETEGRPRRGLAFCLLYAPGMNDEPWRWWEERAAPDVNDLRPYRSPCLVIAAVSVLTLVLLVGAGYVIWAASR